MYVTRVSEKGKAMQKEELYDATMQMQAKLWAEFEALIYAVCSSTGAGEDRYRAIMAKHREVVQRTVEIARLRAAEPEFDTYAESWTEARGVHQRETESGRFAETSTRDSSGQV